MKESDERFTPQSVLDVVREFDNIALDPCTINSNPVRANRWLTKADDGVLSRWASPADRPGIAFVNPPYSRGSLMLWARRTSNAWESESVESVLLVPSDTSTMSVQLLLSEANAVAFWNRRIRFSGDNGAKFANALFYFGERQGRFKRVFSPHATVIVLR